jgi:hypothetical protein
MADISESFRTLVGPMLAQASVVLKTSKEAGDLRHGVVALLVVARILQADMLEMVAPAPNEEMMKALEAEVRREIHAIYTDGWVKH